MYVVLEGENGVGKSTQLGRVKGKLDKMFEHYDKQKVHINILHEGDTVSDKHENWVEEVLDYARDRARLYHFIKDTDCTDITISDRSYYSSLAYQGKQDLERLAFIHNVNQYAAEPDLIIFLNKIHERLSAGKSSGEINDRYYEVLPMSTISIQRQSIEKTTSMIADTIFFKWLYMYDPEYMNIMGMLDETINCLEKIKEEIKDE